MISARKTPALKTKNPIKTLIKTLKRALMVSPYFIKVAVSNINVEKVVNAPQNPTINKSLEFWSSKTFSCEMLVKNPIIKHPIKFTRTVPYGKAVPNIW